MGRALRERAGLRVRIPLRAIHVRSSDPAALDLLAKPFASELVLDELNIKSWGSLAADDGRLCTLRARPNFKVLGKRLGASMRAAAAAIQALPGERVAELRAGRSVTLALDGGPCEIAPGEVEIVVETQAEFDVEASGRFVVFLDTALDDALLAEGLAREAVNRINGLRKDSGLAVEQRIRLRLSAGGDPLLARALEEHAQWIASETLAVDVALEPALSASGEHAKVYDLGDERRLHVSLARA